MFWSEGSKEECKPFVGFVQVFYEKTAKTVGSTAFVSYLTQFLLLNSVSAALG